MYVCVYVFIFIKYENLSEDTMLNCKRLKIVRWTKAIGIWIGIKEEKEEEKGEKCMQAMNRMMLADTKPAITAKVGGAARLKRIWLAVWCGAGLKTRQVACIPANIKNKKIHAFIVEKYEWSCVKAYMIAQWEEEALF